MTTKYYHAYSATMEGCELTDEARAVAKSTWLCMGCRSPKPGVTSLDVHLGLPPGDEILNAVSGYGVPIAHRSLLASLEKEVGKCLYIGKVYGPRGELLKDWATFRGKRRLLIRGSEHVAYRKCTECGRSVYFATGPRYLYPAPPNDIALFESDLRGLIMSEEAFGKSQLDESQGVDIDELTLPASPLDGLVDLRE